MKNFSFFLIYFVVQNKLITFARFLPRMAKKCVQKSNNKLKGEKYYEKI